MARFARSLFLLLFLLAGVTAAAPGEEAEGREDDENLFPRLPIKIVRGLPSAAPVPSPIARPVPFREAAAIPPEELPRFKALLDVSVAADLSGYTYMLFPFRNISQKTTTPTFGSSGFWGLLGLFEGQTTDRVTGTITQRYTDGCPCPGGKRRKTIITLACPSDRSAPSYSLLNVREPRTCEYEAVLQAPEACDDFVAAPLSSAPSSPSSTAAPSSPSLGNSKAAVVSSEALKRRDVAAICAPYLQPAAPGFESAAGTPATEAAASTAAGESELPPMEAALQLLCAELKAANAKQVPAALLSPPVLEDGITNNN